MLDHQSQPSAASPIAVGNSAPSRGTLSLSTGRSAGETEVFAARAVTATKRAASSAAVDTVPLKRLTAGRKALQIAHAGETYLLRITKANKLILTKPATLEKPPTDAKV